MNYHQPPSLQTEKEAAQRLRVSPRTLQKWRILKVGPTWVRVGRCVRYRLTDLDAFVASGEVPTAA
jgi:hypothetical protein